MKTLLIILFLVGNAAANELFGTPIAGLAFNVHDSILCSQTKTWTNQTGQTLYVYKVQVGIWFFPAVTPLDTPGGFPYYSSIADVGINVTRARDGNVLVDEGWDHYANSTAPQPQPVDFGTHPVELLPGDSLVVYEHGYNGFGALINLGGAAWIWYTKGSP